MASDTDPNPSAESSALGGPTASGSCLCSAVSYEVSGPLRPVWQCHCRRCQKTTGNFMAASSALAADITVEQFDALRWYSPDDDPNVAYGFCRRCGSSLFWRVVDQGGEPEAWSICAGTLDDGVALSTEAIWFSDRAAPHTHLDPAARHLPAAEL